MARISPLLGQDTLTGVLHAIIFVERFKDHIKLITEKSMLPEAGI